MAILFSGTRVRLWPRVVLAAALLLAACGTLPVALDKPVSQALADTQARMNVPRFLWAGTSIRTV
jgi:starvation-inducible outer membrane lipoprotein